MIGASSHLLLGGVVHIVPSTQQPADRPTRERFGAAHVRVVGAVTSNEEDRVVSRRVDNPTEATPEDEQTYRAADPDPTDDAADDTSEPTRSE
jgi:hypothetical protein